MWTMDGNAPGPAACSPATTKTWQGALDYVACLNTNGYLGYTDWRLPNIVEMESLIDAEKWGHALPAGHPFTNVWGNKWSSTSFAFDSKLAWTIYMFEGEVYPFNKSFNYYVWPVRSGQNGTVQLHRTGQTTSYAIGDDGDIQEGVAWPSPRFTASTDGYCVTDNLTGLMWVRSPDSVTRMWQQAIDYANGLSLCGYDYWRLPNRKEILSLIDFSQSFPALPLGHSFLNVQSAYYWSSTSSAHLSDGGWTVYMGDGEGSGLDKSYYTYYVWPVRSGQVGPSVHSIIGRVTENDVGLSGVTLALSAATSATVSTASDGIYSLMGLADGAYVLTPSKTGYTFNPPSRDVTLSGMDVTGQDFRACSISNSLSGILKDATTNKPLSGISISVDGTPSATTDAGGFYSISGLSCRTHIIGVILSGYFGYSNQVDISANPTLNINLIRPETVNGTNTNSGYSRDPVNTATGNYTYSRKDSEIPGRGVPFVFERNYNSQDAQDGPLGYGWTHNYNTTLTVNLESTVSIRWGDGKMETWTPDGSGGFVPQYGVFDTLMDNGDGTYTLKKKDLTVYNFDTAGMLSSIGDKNGNTVSLIYAGGNLAQITDTVGRVITFTYDASNHITQITDPIGRTIQFTYDTNGDLVSTTDMNVKTTSYTYDANHQMLTATDPVGNTFVTNIYDDQKRVVVSQKDAKQGVTVYLYDEVNRKTTIIDQMGNTTIHYHDELLRLIKEEDAKGNSISFIYDEAGNRIQVTDKNGNNTKYSYDSRGNVTSKTDAMSNVTTITYDASNNPLTRTDALGNTTAFEYDASGNLIKTTDPLGNYTTITYNAYGQPLTITDPNRNTTTNAYDAEGNLTEVTDPLGNKTTYTYDGVGRRLTVTDPLGGTTAYTYDNNNNLLTVTDALGNVLSYTYDANNNKLTATDPMGNTVGYTYDVKDLLTVITDPLGNTLSYIYDALDRKTSVTDKNGNITSFAYDTVGNLIEVTDPLGNKTSYTYDANGNKLTETDPLGNTTGYTYDVLNRVITVTDPLGNTTTNNYDNLGRVVSTTDARNQTTAFEYDAMGRLKKVTDANGGTVTYTYDANGNRLTMTVPNGNITSYEYDALNRLKTKTEPLGGQYQYSYDAVGNRVSQTDPNGNTIDYAYDELNRLVGITYPDTSVVSFEYDATAIEPEWWTAWEPRCINTMC